MSRKKLFIKDVIVNTGAFGIYMVAYHIIMLPFLAKVLPVETNSHFLLYIMIVSIYTLSTGNELGVLYQVRMGREPSHTVFNDIYHLLFRANILLVIIFIPLLLILNFSLINTVILTIAAVLSNIRLFLSSILRQKKRFKSLLYCNLGYLLGVVLAVTLLLKNSTAYWLPLLLGELLSTVMTVFSEREFRQRLKEKSSKYKAIRREGLDLIGASLLGNVPVYGDKILVLPFLGSYSMSAYYAGTSLSKALMLLVNPINGVLLSWLSSDRESDKRFIVKKILNANVLIVIGLSIISYPMIYLATYILYRQFLPTVLTIIIPLALNSAFTTSTTILKIVFLRYYKISSIKYFNLLKIVLFVALTPVGVYFGGLLGFSYAILFSSIVMWLIYFLVMLKD